MILLSNLFSLLCDLPVLIYVISGLIITWFVLHKRHDHGNIPPIPVRPYPLLGHIPIMKKGVLETFKNWKNMNGNIFSIYLGPHLAVVLCGWDVMKEALIKKGEHFAGRTLSHMSSKDIKESGTARLGIISNEGESWKEIRSVSMQILRDFGMGKNWLSDKIAQEIQVYMDTLSSFNGQPTDVRLLTNAAVSNVVCALLIGHRLDYKDPDFVHLLNLLIEQVVLLSNTGVVRAFPFLRYLPGDLFKAKKVVSNSDAIRNLFCEKFIRLTKETGEKNNFIARFFDEMELQKDNSDTHLNESNLISVMGDLFAAGSETTSTTILWALLFAIRHPHFQEKVYNEIIDVIGPDRPPDMMDRASMNYTTAFIMETQRLGSIAPLSLPHVCTKTIEVGGYTIPEGTRIIPNLHEVMHDEDTWGDPLNFRPERFLNDEGKVFVPEQFVPFSVGRRYCMGESLARMELFLFITSIVQRFLVLPEDSTVIPPPTRIFGLTSAPTAYKVRFMERKQNKTVGANNNLGE